jgi:3-deoxy-D-glycero-D-galacto-nononate 9-phosphatase
MLPKLIFTDIDGVWTDGGMYYDEKGNELKKFNTTDSAGVTFLKMLNIPVCIITGEETEIVRRRATKLNIDLLYLGVKDKLGCALEICGKFNIKIGETAFVGNDINDILLLQEAGYSAVPADTPVYIAKYASLVMNKKGGEGAFREFIETILAENNLLEEVIRKTVESFRGKQ